VIALFFSIIELNRSNVTPSANRKIYSCVTVEREMTPTIWTRSRINWFSLWQSYVTDRNNNWRVATWKSICGYVYIYVCISHSTRFSPASKIHERRIAVLSATHDRRRLSILPANDLQQQKMDKEKKKERKKKRGSVKAYSRGSGSGKRDKRAMMVYFLIINNIIITVL